MTNDKFATTTLRINELHTALTKAVKKENMSYVQELTEIALEAVKLANTSHQKNERLLREQRKEDMVEIKQV